jgi:hypothetical protein
VFVLSLSWQIIPFPSANSTKWPVAIDAGVVALPIVPSDGVEMSTVLLGRPGLQRATRALGAVLRNVHNTTRIRDANVETLSYWSDNAAGYSFWSVPGNDIDIWGTFHAPERCLSILSPVCCLLSTVLALCSVRAHTVHTVCESDLRLPCHVPQHDLYMLQCNAMCPQDRLARSSSSCTRSI